MKVCKHCNAEVEDEILVCPECGADMLEDSQPEAEPAQETPAQETPVQEAPVQEPQKPEEPKKKAPWGLIVGLGLAALVVIGLIVGKSAADQKQEDPAEPPAQEEVTPEETPAETPAEQEVPQLAAGHHVNAAGMPSHSIYAKKAEDGSESYYYTNESGEHVAISQEELDSLLDQTVATCGDEVLTNRDLLFFNDQQTYGFLSMYGNYLGAMMDPNKPMDEQLALDGASTWQQFFLTASTDMFQQIAAIYQEAVAQGYELPEEEAAQFDVDKQLEEMTMYYGAESSEALLKDQMGPAATVENYKKFLTMGTLAGSYANYLADQIEITPEEVEAYYDENAEMLQQNYYLQKIDKPNVNVRHILISPESTTLEDGTTEISDEAWAAAEKTAQEIYDSWKNGDATEDSFAALAGEKTQDPGSQSTGGLYENVYPGQMVPQFNDWCFADGRKTGDTGIVKTDYGYHIMFFVSEGEEIYWRTAVREMMIGEQSSAQRSEIAAKYEGSQDLTKAVLVMQEPPAQLPVEDPSQAPAEVPAD